MPTLLKILLPNCKIEAASVLCFGLIIANAKTCTGIIIIPAPTPCKKAVHIIDNRGFEVPLRHFIIETPKHIKANPIKNCESYLCVNLPLTNKDKKIPIPLVTVSIQISIDTSRDSINNGIIIIIGTVNKPYREASIRHAKIANL